MLVRELPFAEMEDYGGRREVYLLDLITREKTAESKSPVVLFIHGGGFLKPNDRKQAYISFFAKSLTEAGYAVVSPDYPQFDDEIQFDAAGGQQAGYAKAAKAIHLAFGYLSENADTLGIDADRIAIIGGSAGGWAAFYAIANYGDSYRSFINCWGAPEILPSVAGFPPTLSVHGTEDALVPYALEAAAQEAFAEAGVEHRLITLQGRGHTPLMDMPVFLPEMLTHLAEHFKS